MANPRTTILAWSLYKSVILSYLISNYQFMKSWVISCRRLLHVSSSPEARRWRIKPALFRWGYDNDRDIWWRRGLIWRPRWKLTRVSGQRWITWSNIWYTSVVFRPTISVWWSDVSGIAAWVSAGAFYRRRFVSTDLSVYNSTLWHNLKLATSH